MGAIHYVAFYVVASIALVGIAIIGEVSLLPNEPTASTGMLFGAQSKRLGRLIEFGIFGIGHSRITRRQLDSVSEVSDNSNKESSDDSDSFDYDSSRTSDFPDWLPSFLQNGWAFVAIAVICCSILTLIFLGPRKIHEKARGWWAWFEDSDHILRGLTFPQFPIHMMTGTFSVAGPIFVLRVLELDVALLGLLIMIEHAVQVLTQYWCGTYVETAGNKEGQRRSALILFIMSLFILWIPFLSESWTKQNAWLVFSFFAVARMLFAWGTNQFDANYNAAINNSSFLPPPDIVKTLDIFFAFNMLGTFLGAIIALTIQEYTDTRWILTVPFVLTIIMYLIVESIPQDEHHVTFPPDPADLSAEAKKNKWQNREANDRHTFAPKSVGSIFKLRRPEEDEGEGLPWIYPIWFEDKPRWLVIQFVVILLTFSTLAMSFTFMLPLAAMSFGFSDEDVGFLVAMPSIVGLNLFWFGSAFDHTNYVVKSCVAAVGFALAYFTAYSSTLFTGLFAASFIFAVTVCYSCDLILLLRICYLHYVTRYSMKTYFANVQEYASHLVAFNAPLIALVMDLLSVRAAFAIWGALSVFAVLWVGLIARNSIVEVTTLDHVADGDEETEKAANDIFDQIDTNKDQMLSKEELLAYMAQAHVAGDARGVLLDGILRIADRDGDGSISRLEWRKSYSAVVELVRDEEVAADAGLFVANPAAGGAQAGRRRRSSAFQVQVGLV